MFPKSLYIWLTSFLSSSLTLSSTKLGKLWCSVVLSALILLLQSFQTYSNSIKMTVTGGAANSLNRRKARLPPKRGQIKVKIISKFLEIVVRAASKAGRGLCRKKKVAEEEGSKHMPQKEH
jgi:hypothetical protein